MARLAGAGIAAAAAAVAACFSTPKFHEPSDGQTDSRTVDQDQTMIDAYVSVDGDPLACKFDTFDSNSGNCGSSNWAGTPQAQNGNVAITGGELVLQITGSGASYARCQAPPMAYTRFTVDIAAAGQGSNGDETFIGLDSGTARYGVLFTWNVGDPGMKVLCGIGPTATTGAIPSDLRFVQIEVSVLGAVRIASSLDGDSFAKELGSCSPGPAALASTMATITVDRSVGSGAAQQTLIGSVELCK